jgi:hypothetical protein
METRAEQVRDTMVAAQVRLNDREVMAKESALEQEVCVR